MTEDIATEICMRLTRDLSRFRHRPRWVKTCAWYLQTLIETWPESKATTIIEFLDEHIEPDGERDV
ncbi:hypothetical protein NVP2275O_241 [Vibrio phage 2.275.O._10N.286.54.E11]|nr:hypothetical protein NVP2275O_241 [Vibrio phage 2.275.O._10N.286.54.E11]